MLARFLIHIHIHNHSRLGYLTGAGSDYAAFVHYLGITSVDMSYTYDRVRKTASSWKPVVVLYRVSNHAIVSFRVKRMLASTPPTTRRTTPSTTAPSTSTPVGDQTLPPIPAPGKAALVPHTFASFASGFVSHQAVARTAGSILIRLADSLVLPLNCSDYAESLEGYLTAAVSLYEVTLQTWNISMGNHVTRGVVTAGARK